MIGADGQTPDPVYAHTVGRPHRHGSRQRVLDRHRDAGNCGTGDVAYGAGDRRGEGLSDGRCRHCRENDTGHYGAYGRDHRALRTSESLFAKISTSCTSHPHQNKKARRAHARRA